MKKILLLLFLILSAALVSAHGEETFAEAEEIIKAKVACESLTDNQLEVIGDYYMGQMHPGEAHEAMDEMMGGEGSKSLMQMHINMGKSFYCGEHEGMSSGMMSMMMGRGTGMMGSEETINMMGGKNMAYGMMGSGMGIYGLVYFALAAFVFSVIFWMTHNWIVQKKKR